MQETPEISSEPAPPRPPAPPERAPPPPVVLMSARMRWARRLIVLGDLALGAACLPGLVALLDPGENPKSTGFAVVLLTCPGLGIAALALPLAALLGYLAWNAGRKDSEPERIGFVVKGLALAGGMVALWMVAVSRS